MGPVKAPNRTIIRLGFILAKFAILSQLFFDARLTFGFLWGIMHLQIPKIAILINPVCGMHKAHHPLSFNLGEWFSFGQNS